MNDDLPRSTPERQGMSSSAITAFLDGLEAQDLELHSFMLLRHGNVVAEGWWAPYGPEGVQLLYSLSKSFTATAIGLAVHEGRLSVDDPVLSFFPDEAPSKPHPNLAAMRVRHLLTMATGHLQDTLEPVARNHAHDWLRGFLALPPEGEPGSVFTYNQGATLALSAIIQKVTGMRLLEYLRPRLLEPLGITRARWDRTPEGTDQGFTGLHLTTEAVARFGQLYLQGGRWQGTQLVPEAWTREATRLHIATTPPPENGVPDWAQGYGYQFWRCRNGAYRGDGAFGQFCVVTPEQDAVLVMTGATLNMQAVLDLVWEHLLPAFQNAPLPEEAEAARVLQERLAKAALPPVTGERSTPVAETVLGQTYRFTASPHSIQTPPHNTRFDLREMKLETTPEGWSLELKNADGTYILACGYDTWLSVSSSPFGAYPGPLRVSAAWTAAHTFTVKIIYLETPHTLILDWHFGGEEVRLEPRWNVQFGALERPPLTGTRA